MQRFKFKVTSEIYFSIQILDLWGQAKLEQVQAVKKKRTGTQCIKTHVRIYQTRTGIQKPNKFFCLGTY